MGFERYNNATVGDKYREEAATGFADLLQSNGQDLDAYRRIFHGTINANLNPRANEPLDFSNPYPPSELSDGIQAQNQWTDSDGDIRYQKKVKDAYIQSQEGMNETGGNSTNTNSCEGDWSDGIAYGAGVSAGIDRPSSLAEAAMYPPSYVME